MVRYHEMYQSVKNHWGYAFIKRHHLDKAVRWGWTTINYANPWYWGRYAVYHGGKEVAARLLMARIADLVGEEAVRLYGRRQPPVVKRQAQTPAGAEPARHHPRCNRDHDGRGGLRATRNPGPFGEWLVRSLADLWYRLDRRHRRITLANLEFAYGDELSPAERERLARRLFPPFRAPGLGGW